MAEPIQLHSRLRKEQGIKKLMLDRLEATSEELAIQQTKLKPVGEIVLDKVAAAIKGGDLSPYKAAVAYGKCVDSIAKLAQIQMGLYDRLAGTVGAFGEFIEDDEAEDFDPLKKEIERESERLCYELVKREVLKKQQQGAS